MIVSLRAIELNSPAEISSLVASRRSAAFLPSKPVQKDGTSRTQHRAEPEQRQPTAFRKVINLPPAFARAEDELGDFVGAAEYIGGERMWCIA